MATHEMTDAEIQAYLDNEGEVAAEIDGMGPGEIPDDYVEPEGDE